MQLYEKIPNNVNLSHNRRLQRALEKWQPNYLKWWKEAGPADFQEDLIYLRTAISVDAKEVGGKKQLIFEGSASEPSEPPTVGAGAEGGSGDESASK